MILFDETLLNFGYHIDKCKKTANIYYKCDYCNFIGYKRKDILFKSRKIIEKDCCKQCSPIKIKEINLKLYGVDASIKRTEVKDKIKKTNLEKYGTECALSNTEIKDKIKKTNLEKYGTECTLSNIEIRKKCNETNLEKYGVPTPIQRPEIKDKIKKTNLEKYGCIHPSINLEIKEKVKKTNLEKYGKECSLLNEEIRKKCDETNLKKYGTIHPFSNIDIQKKSIVSKILKYGTPYPNKYGKTQKEIQEWLNGFGYNFQSNCKILQGKEIDLYDENLKLAIEYCGLFWHTENSPQPRNKKYHYDKYKKCLENNIRLITIYEDEWLNRKSQVQNLLKSIINKFTIKLFARKCVVKEIDKIIANNFINDYHIQGNVKSIKFASGIYYNEELLGCISLGNHHRNNEDLVLNRLCFKTDVQIVGGASKLFSRCVSYIKENKINKIISWSDNRYSQGNVYNKLNFRLDKELLPDYSYINLSNTKEGRLSKQSCKKRNIKCPEDLTEREYMYQLGYSRIWDCGKKRWIYEV